MRNKRAKQLRRAAYFDLKKWRSMTNEERYSVESHYKYVGTGKDRRKQYYAGTLYCRGQRSIYNYMKKGLRG